MPGGLVDYSSSDESDDEALHVSSGTSARPAPTTRAPSAAHPPGEGAETPPPPQPHPRAPVNTTATVTSPSPPPRAPFAVDSPPSSPAGGTGSPVDFDDDDDVVAEDDFLGGARPDASSSA